MSEILQEVDTEFYLIIIVVLLFMIFIRGK